METSVKIHKKNCKWSSSTVPLNQSNHLNEVIQNINSIQSDEIPHVNISEFIKILRMNEQ